MTLTQRAQVICDWFYSDTPADGDLGFVKNQLSETMSEYESTVISDMRGILTDYKKMIRAADALAKAAKHRRYIETHDVPIPEGTAEALDSAIAAYEKVRGRE